MKKVISVPVPKFSEFSGLGKESAQNYVLAENSQVPFLSNIIIKPFESGLEKLVTHDMAENEETQEKSVEVDGYKFQVKSGMSENKSSPKEVYDSLVFYLGKLKSEHAKGIRRRGVMTEQDEPYIDINLFLEELDEKRGFVKERSFKCKSEFLGELPGPKSFSAPLLDYSSLDNLANNYLAAKSMLDYDKNEIIEPFVRDLKHYTGYSTENMPEETIDTWHHETGISFKILSVPTTTTSYAKILDQLSKKGKKVTKKSGELVKILANWEDESTKGYKKIVRGEGYFVEINSLLERMSQLKQENTKPKLNQIIYPITGFVIQTPGGP